MIREKRRGRNIPGVALLRSQFVGRRKKYIYIYIDVEEIKMARKENREIELEGGGGDGTRVHTGCRE